MADADTRSRHGQCRLSADGDEVYAAICATSLTAARFSEVKANDILTIRSRISAVSRTQTSTTHLLSVAGRSVGRLELISSFVRREIQGRNRSIARVTVPKPETKSYEVSLLAQHAANIRGGRLQTYWGLPVVAAEAMRTFRFDPSTAQNFNVPGRGRSRHRNLVSQQKTAPAKGCFLSRQYRAKRKRLLRPHWMVKRLRHAAWRAATRIRRFDRESIHFFTRTLLVTKLRRATQYMSAAAADCTMLFGLTDCEAGAVEQRDRSVPTGVMGHYPS